LSGQVSSFLTKTKFNTKTKIIFKTKNVNKKSEAFFVKHFLSGFCQVSIFVSVFVNGLFRILTAITKTLFLFQVFVNGLSGFVNMTKISFETLTKT